MTWRDRFFLWRELQRYRFGGMYQFSFRHLTKWDKIKLQRYVNWQLPTCTLKNSLMRISVDEYIALKSKLDWILPPKVVMDFGCGTGRSSIFFKHMFKWNSTKFVLVDSQQSVYGSKGNLNPEQREYHQDVSALDNNFYTDFDLIDKLLESNGLNDVKLIDLRIQRKILESVRDVDIFYSFHCVGYHYDPLSIFTHYNLHSALRPNALIVLGVRKERDSLSKELNLDKFLSKGYVMEGKYTGNHLQDYIVMRKQ